MKSIAGSRSVLSPVLRSLAFRLAAVNFFLNLSMEASIVFLPLYAKSIGASNRDVGFIAAIYGLTFFASSLWFGRQTDIHGRVRFIRLGLGLLVVAYLSQMITQTSLGLMLARGGIGFSLGIASAAIVAYTYDNQKEVGKTASYGSLGWLFGAVMAAILQNYEALFFTSAIASGIGFIIAFRFKEAPVTVRVSVPLFPLPLLKADWKIYLPLFLRQFGAHAIWSVMPLYLASIGATRFWIAVLDVLNTASQFILMRMVERYDPGKVFRLGLAFSAVTFLCYGIASRFWQILPVQLLLGLSWSCVFIGSLSYLLRKNVERGTVSAQVYSTMYLSAGLGPFMGGAVSQAWGFTSLMYIGSGLAFVAFFFARGLTFAKKPVKVPATQL